MSRDASSASQSEISPGLLSGSGTARPVEHVRVSLLCAEDGLDCTSAVVSRSTATTPTIDIDLWRLHGWGISRLRFAVSLITLGQQYYQQYTFDGLPQPIFGCPVQSLGQTLQSSKTDYFSLQPLGETMLKYVGNHDRMRPLPPCHNHSRSTPRDSNRSPGE